MPSGLPLFSVPLLLLVCVPPPPSVAHALERRVKLAVHKQRDLHLPSQCCPTHLSHQPRACSCRPKVGSSLPSKNSATCPCRVNAAAPTSSSSSRLARFQWARDLRVFDSACT